MPIHHPEGFLLYFIYSIAHAQQLHHFYGVFALRLRTRSGTGYSKPELMLEFFTLCGNRTPPLNHCSNGEMSDAGAHCLVCHMAQIIV